MTIIIEAQCAIDCRDVIGEGPAWDEPNVRLIWSDNKNGIVREARYDQAGHLRLVRQWNLDRRIGAALPRERGGLIVAGGTDFFMLDEDGAITPFARLDVDPASCHMNDAKCDPQGRLWAGTLDADVNKPGQPIVPGRCSLFRIDVDGSVAEMLPGVTVSNGLCWSADGKTFYYIDSYTRRVDGFDFDGARGELSNRRPVISFAPGDGAPDGMSIDVEDCLWVAMVGTGEVRRYRPDGVLLARVKVPTVTPSSCAFGGPDGGTLFITSARVRLPQSAFHTLTHGFTVEADDVDDGGKAGALFACRPGVTGAPARAFGG